MEAGEGLPEFTVYRPVDLKSVAERLPVVVYGNGGCVHAGNRSEVFLREIAAHGYLVIAPGPIVTEPDVEGAASVFGQYPTERLAVAIDWALRENTRVRSRFHGKLDTDHITAMGRSCGGLQAIVTGADPRISNVVVINSGIIRNGGVMEADGSVSPRPYLPGSDADLARLHTPVLYLVGGPSDQAYENAERDFEMIAGVPVFSGNMDVGHSGTFEQPGGGAMGKAAIDWLDWWTKGDNEAGQTFDGPDCGLCQNPAWAVKRKNI
jgi:dienelactone hydrolase